MKSLILSLAVTLFATASLAKIDVVKVNESLNDFDIKAQVLNAVYYGYYDYDSSPTEEEWDSLVASAEMTLIEKTQSSLPENAKDYSPEKRITTILKVVYTPVGEIETCTVEVRRKFATAVWKVTPKGGVYEHQTPNYWDADVLECN